MNGSFALGILAPWPAGFPAAGGRGVVREAGAAPGQAGRAAPGARRAGGRAWRAAQMELTTAQPARDTVPHRAEGEEAGDRPAPHRVTRAAARRRVGAYTATVTAAGFALLVVVAPAAVRVAARDPAPVLLLAALVLAAELMPLELGRPGTRDSTTMSQPFAFALVLGWGTPAGVVALGTCSALADLAGGQAARKVLFNSAQLAIALGAAGAVYDLAGGRPGPSGPALVSLPAFAAAALAFFVVNSLLVEAVLVLAGGAPALDRVPPGGGAAGLGVGHAAGPGPGGGRGRPDQPRPGPDPGADHRRRVPGLPGRHPGRPGAGPGRGRGRAGPGGRGRAGPPGRGRAGPDPPAPGERPPQARPAGHRLPRAEDPAHGDPGHPRHLQPPRDRPRPGRAARVRGHGRPPGHPA